MCIILHDNLKATVNSRIAKDCKMMRNVNISMQSLLGNNFGRNQVLKFYKEPSLGTYFGSIHLEHGASRGRRGKARLINKDRINRGNLNA